MTFMTAFQCTILGLLLFPSVVFGQDVSKPDPSGHSVVYQEGVEVTVKVDGKDKTEVIPVYGVAGLSFPVGRIEIDRRGKLSNTIIDIEDAKQNILIPNKGSAVPINMGFGKNSEFGASFFTHAVNVTWRFSKAGIQFDSKDATYIVEKAMATISFTEDGIKIDGVKKNNKKRK